MKVKDFKRKKKKAYESIKYCDEDSEAAGRFYEISPAKDIESLLHQATF